MIKEKVSIDSDIWSKIPLGPNQVTALSLLFGFFGVLFIFLDKTYARVSFLFFIFAFFLDAIDGAIARAKKLVTNRGAFIDGVFDRIVDLCIIFALYLIIPRHTYLVNLLFLFTVFISALPSFITAYADHKKAMDKKNATRIPKSLGRPERSLILLMVFLFGIFGFFNYMLYGILIVILMSLWTSAVRFSFVVLN